MLATILSVSAKDLGVMGETFPIQEKSILQVIREKLQALATAGALEDHQHKILEQTKARIRRPAAVEGITKTVKPRLFTYDLSITVPYDLKDHEGQVFHKKGTRVNPLDTHTLRSPLLFVDGDDETQVAWAIKQVKAAKSEHKPLLILVKGSPFDLSEKVGFPIYFDQGGYLVKKLGIGQVPARVKQQEKTLIVEEVNASTL